MKRYGNLYPKIIEFKNLYLAAKKAQRAKRYLPYVMEFNFNLEGELFKLQEELAGKTYLPGGYRSFYIYAPKKRLISAAPYRDRVVHHAVMNVLEQVFDGRLIYDSYACRQDKGTHKAILRANKFCREYRYVLKCDLEKFFPSIDHEILKDKLRRILKDKELLWLLDAIIDNSCPQEPVYKYFPGDDLFTPLERRRGLPIGNLTSQWFANYYLNDLDQYMKRELKVKGYLRYMDDFLCFSDSKIHLADIRKAAECFLAGERLSLHPNKRVISRTRDGINFLGFKIFPEFRLLQRSNKVRVRRRLKMLKEQYENGSIGQEEIRQSVMSWIGHAMWGNTWRFRKRLFSEFSFKGPDRKPAGVSCAAAIGTIQASTSAQLIARAIRRRTSTTT